MSSTLEYRRFLPLSGAVVVLAGALAWAKLEHAPLFLGSQLPPAPYVDQEVRAPYDPDLVHRTLAFDASQTRYDPGNATFQAMLAGQYLESYRETGDSADASRGEQAARASLKIRQHHNSTAYFQLSRALLTQHRFQSALNAARSAAAEDPVGLRECADIEIELGDYSAAARDLAKSSALMAGQTPAQTDDPAYLSLKARFNELRGDSAGQLALLTRATNLADKNVSIPVQSIAWFHERLGRCLGMMGRLDEAEKSYLVGLKAFPRDYRTMAALAHLDAARGNWKETIRWANQAAAIVPAPETLALLGDAYQALGQPAKAQSQFRLMEQIGQLATAQGIIYDRQRAMYYADHNRKPAEAVRLARGEMEDRHDIYTFDTLAWTLFKAGRVAEAKPYAQRALAFGTKDASLYFHAGMIAAAQGDRKTASNYLKKALQINPYFHPTQPQEARQTLANLNSVAPVKTMPVKTAPAKAAFKL